MKKTCYARMVKEKYADEENTIVPSIPYACLPAILYLIRLLLRAYELAACNVFYFATDRLPFPLRCWSVRAGAFATRRPRVAARRAPRNVQPLMMTGMVRYLPWNVVS